MRCFAVLAPFALAVASFGCSSATTACSTSPPAAGATATPPPGGHADPYDPRLTPEPALDAALENPAAHELWRYLLHYTGTVLSPESYCGGRLEGRPRDEWTVGNVLASHLGFHDGRRFFEIGCGRPGDAVFEAPDAPPCPSPGAGDAQCLPCVMMMWVDRVTEDPALFLISGRLHFQYREGAPLDPSSVFCLEAG